jgi:large repetitive protein
LLPSTSENDPVLIDEDDISSAFSQGIGNTDSLGDDNPINVTGVLKFFAGDPPTTVDFASMHLDAVEGKDSQGNTGPLTSQGHDLVYVWFGETLKAVWAIDESHVVFQIEVNPTTGAYTLTLFDQLDHPFTNDPSTPADDATVLGFEDNLIVDLIYTVTDADGQTVTGTLTVDFDDDMPRVTGAVESRIVDERRHHDPVVAGHEPPPDDGDADHGFGRRFRVGFRWYRRSRHLPGRRPGVHKARGQ